LDGIAIVRRVGADNAHRSVCCFQFSFLVCEMKPMLVRCFSGRACFARDSIWQDYDTLDISRD
jgi:hypothetical protein